MNAFKPLKVGAAAACTAIVLVTGGCGSSTAGPEPHRTSRGGGVRVAIPAGWRQVRLAHLRSADVPLELASFKAEGAVQTICNPQRVAEQIPDGGALLQILRDRATGGRGGGAEGRLSPHDLRAFPPLPDPFPLGTPRSYECGEAYNLSFRKSGQLFQLRIWTAPSGPSPEVRTQIEQLMDSLRVSGPAGHAVRDLPVSYGPFIGLRCRLGNSIYCDKIGLDVVLGEKASSVSASIAGRRIPLRTPGAHNGVRGKDWVGLLTNVELTRKGSPFYIRGTRGSAVWNGKPPVYVPIQITATSASGQRRTATFPHVFLAPGWG